MTEEPRAILDPHWSPDWRVVLLVALSVFGVYGGSLDDGFHFDDALILDDSNVTNPERWRHFLNPLRLRQVTFFTFYLNHLAGGEDPFGYHLVNVGLHAVNGVLLYLLLGPILGGWIAGAASLMFVTHPVQSEAVVYVYQRSTLLATLFSLLGLLALRRLWLPASRDRPGPARAPVVGTGIACFILAAWSKEAALAVPLVLMLVPGFPGRAALGAGVAVAAAGGGALALLAWLGEATVGFGVLDQVGPGTYLLTELRVVWTYLRLLVVPYPQALEYEVAPVAEFWSVTALAGAAGVAAMIACGIALGRRPGLNWAGIGVLAFLLFLAPTSSVIPSLDFAFEHRLYIPMLGAVLFSAVMIARAPRRTLVLSLLVAVWAGLAWNRGRVWSSEVALWEDTVAKAPNKARAWFNLGGAYMAAGDARAREAFLKVLDLDPDSVDSPYNLGILEHRSGNPVDALAWYERAILRDPAYWPASNNIGNVRATLGDHAGALDAYERVLRLNPDYWPAQYNMALAYTAMNRPDQAVPRLRTVLDWEPEFAEARVLLALSLTRLGRTVEADRERERLGSDAGIASGAAEFAPLSAPD